MVCYGSRCAFMPTIRVRVDVGGERPELFIQFVLEVPHGLGEMFLGESWVGVGGVTHRLNLLRDGLSSGGLG